MGVTKCGKPQCNSDGDRRTGGDATDRLVGDEVITLMITLMISLFRRDDLIIADLISACHRRDAFRRSRHLERVIPALVNVRHSQLLFKQMPSFVLNGEVVGGKRKTAPQCLQLSWELSSHLVCFGSKRRQGVREGLRTFLLSIVS